MFASQMSRLHKRDVSTRASISGSQAGGYYFVAMLFDRWSGEWHAHCCTDGIPNYPQTCVLSSGHLLRIRPLLQVKQEPSGAREENKIPDLVYLYNSKNLRCVQLIQFSSVAQSCPTLCEPMDCSTPGLPVHHQFPEVAQTHVHRVGDAIQPSHSLLSPSPPAFNLSQHQGLFQWVNSLHYVDKIMKVKSNAVKNNYSIGTWNVRSMNQSKLIVFKQEMARVNINILGIGELKWIGMGKFSSDVHYIYYCGQESLRRNGVAFIVNGNLKCSTWV